MYGFFHARAFSVSNGLLTKSEHGRIRLSRDLSMGESEQKWYLARQDKTFGPYDLGQLAKFVKDGQATQATLICLKGEETWLPLGSTLPGLFPQECYICLLFQVG